LAARGYPEHFERLVKEGEYSSDIVFYVDEISFYWKTMSSRTFNPVKRNMLLDINLSRTTYIILA
jgi:hypothetical protein